MPDGLVIASKGIIYDVLSYDDQKSYLCRLRGKLRLKEKEGKNPVVIGDKVKFTKISDKEGIIDDLYPRRNKISRLKGKNEIIVIAANVDRLCIFNSIKYPPIDTVFLDRLLVIAEREEMEAIIIINKIDLAKSEEEYRKIGDIYEKIGYKVIYTSVKNRIGLQELKNSLIGKINVLVGFSGVGKSSLINAIFPNINLKTQEVNPKTGFGRHTTRNAMMFKLEGGGYIADTPGIRKFIFEDVEPEELSLYFPEMIEPRKKCKFNLCLHLHEKECGVKEAVAKGEIHPSRYKSYKILLNECKKRVETYWD